MPLKKTCCYFEHVVYVYTLTPKCTVCLIARTHPLPWFEDKLS